MAKAYEVTSYASGPRMVCAYGEDSGIESEYATIKAALKLAKKRGIAVVAITLTVDEDAAPSVTLCGTQDYVRTGK